jgi:hypothetical protein
MVLLSVGILLLSVVVRCGNDIIASEDRDFNAVFPIWAIVLESRRRVCLVGIWNLSCKLMSE